MSFRAKSRNLKRSLHSFHSVEMTKGRALCHFERSREISSGVVLPIGQFAPDSGQTILEVHLYAPDLGQTSAPRA